MSEELKPWRTRPPKAHFWKHGACARDERLYTLWKTIAHRCENPKRAGFKNYGGRGICLCQEWKDPHVFMDWAYEHGYHQGLQIDRINVDGDYCPENCRFVTPKENSNNRRNTKTLLLDGQKVTVQEASKERCVSQYTIYHWITAKGVSYAEQRLQANF